MKISIITNANPYILDYLVDRSSLPALTRKNADFIEAIVNLDSNYAKDFIINKPHNDYDPFKNCESADGKYYGSTRYWFNEMTKQDCNFKRCVLGAIISIDSTNSTHLEASINGRRRMCEIICEHCTNHIDLVNMLNVPFNPSNHNHLLSLLTTKCEAKKGGARFNLSFASKFCSYASKFLGANNSYSKYDNIVSDALPEYVWIYLREKRKKREYKINTYQNADMNEEQDYQYRLDVFYKYSLDIDRIINVLCENGININRDEFDHIIWYGTKGR